MDGEWHMSEHSDPDGERDMTGQFGTTNITYT